MDSLVPCPFRRADGMGWIFRQCVRALDYALGHSPVTESKLSKDGKDLVEDFRDIIRIAKQIVVEKNDDELLQNFM